MKLLVVISSLRGGGAERVLSGMVNYWADLGWQIILVTLDEPVGNVYPISKKVCLKHIYFDYGANKISKFHCIYHRFVRLRKIIFSESPDAVLSFMTSTNVFVISATIGMTAKIVVAERTDPIFNNELGKFWNWGRKALYRYANTVVAQTPAVQSWLIEHTSAETIVIPNLLRKLPVCNVRREKLVVAVGRLGREKGFDLLVRAFALVHSNNPDWRMVILGEGAERDLLTNLVDESGLDEHVELLGWVTDVEEWYGRASLVVQPSRYEGFPNVVLEAMGMGAAVIASSSGAAEIIEDGVNGRLVPVEDIEGLASVMNELMSDGKQRALLGEAAVHVCDKYSQERVMKLWEVALKDPI